MGIHQICILAITVFISHCHSSLLVVKNSCILTGLQIASSDWLDGSLKITSPGVFVQLQMVKLALTHTEHTHTRDRASGPQVIQ